MTFPDSSVTIDMLAGVEPVVTVVLGALLLGEPVTLLIIAGGLLVIGGVLLVQSEGAQPGVLPEAPAQTEPEG